MPSSRKIRTVSHHGPLQSALAIRATGTGVPWRLPGCVSGLQAMPVLNSPVARIFLRYHDDRRSGNLIGGDVDDPTTAFSPETAAPDHAIKIAASGITCPCTPFSFLTFMAKQRAEEEAGAATDHRREKEGSVPPAPHIKRLMRRASAKSLASSTIWSTISSGHRSPENKKAGRESAGLSKS